MNYWFTSDWHLEHYNIIKYANRPFSNVKEMNETIINNFNNVVRKNDIVYYVGDFLFERDYEKYKNKFLDLLGSRLNGTWIFIVGNHDHFFHEDHLFLGKWYTFSMKDIKIGNTKITLCHYPMITYNCSHFNAWNLYGHHHNNDYQFKGKKENVCVDVHNFFPVNYETLLVTMENKENNFDFIDENNRR